MNHQEDESGLGVPILFGLVLKYFGFALAIALDELILRTNYIHSHSPDWFVEAVRIVYWPIIKCVEWVT
ncbi:MAG: hypothetical protein R3B91_13830 [Planctomycetaceae bacterium]